MEPPEFLATRSTFRWRRNCVVLGYASFAISLCLPAVEPGAFTSGYGYECLYWSIAWLLEWMIDIWQFQSWPKVSPADGLFITAGWANSWLLAGWILLFFRYRAARIASAAWGFAGLAVALAVGTQLREAPLAGYYLWCAAFALVATGMLLSGRAPYN